MRASTSRPDTSWMDAENEWERQRCPNPALRPGLGSQGLYLQQLRVSYNRHWRDTLPSPNRRQTRYVAYALNNSGGVADDDLSVVRRHVESVNGVVAYELTDTCAAPLNRRSGWAEAARLLSLGFVDGIAAVDRSAISLHDVEYEGVVNWIGHRPALLALATPEGAT
ncbi:hypothetical protein [Streptomyces sp. NBC_01304]|uniref:hypothetical protein n=1 Tax=Streptomyces sp. NBC_01304 TaxID=2903818 RepID=UPI002E129E99|nr:hypothetical protein OG430_40945 [Streptomyces sp. NBC_01304]